MKKALLLLLMLAIEVMTATAQIEIMRRKVFKADPLTDTQGYTTWTSYHVQLVEENDGTTYIEIRNPKHIFSDWFSVKVGLYDNNNKLLYMSEKWHCGISEDERKMWLKFGFNKESSEYTDTIPEGTIKTADGTQYELARIQKYTHIMRTKDVARFLKNTNGYIRITTPLYGGDIFDVKSRIAKPTKRKLN